MFRAEGIFFVGLLLAASLVLAHAYRAERRYDRARELFLAGVTHEFRTPLASLRLHAETLARPDLDPSGEALVRERLLGEVARLDALVAQILDVSRGGEPPEDAGTLDLAAVVRETLEDLQPIVARAGAEVHVEMEQPLLVRGGRETLSVAVRNLIENAVVHGGAPARVEVRGTCAGASHRLTVADRGPGIPAASRRAVFESFVRLTSGRHAANGSRGAGLGLYLARRNVEALGGRIELASREGEGATFTITLPAADGSAVS